MGTLESSPTVAGVYRDRAAELEEKAEKLADSNAAQRAEELFADGWRAWTVDGVENMTHPQARYIGSDSSESSLDWRGLQEREGSKVIWYLRVLTYYSGWLSDQEQIRPVTPRL